MLLEILFAAKQQLLRQTVRILVSSNAAFLPPDGSVVLDRSLWKLGEVITLILQLLFWKKPEPSTARSSILPFETRLLQDWMSRSCHFLFLDCKRLIPVKHFPLSTRQIIKERNVIHHSRRRITGPTKALYFRLKNVQEYKKMRSAQTLINNSLLCITAASQKGQK